MTHDSELKLLLLIAQPQIHCTPFSILAVREAWITRLRPPKPPKPQKPAKPLRNKNYYHNTKSLKCVTLL